MMFIRAHRHSDGELCFAGGWFVVVAELPDARLATIAKIKIGIYSKSRHVLVLISRMAIHRRMCLIDSETIDTLKRH